MVKKTLIGLVLFLLVSCSKTDYIRVDNILVYQNIFDTMVISVDSIENRSMINDTMFVANFYEKIKRKVEVRGKLKAQLISEYVKLEDNFSKINDGSDYKKFNYYKNAQHLYYCGKINLNKKVKSMLFFYQYDMGVNNITFKVSPLCELIIYNFVNNKLRSIAVISSQLDKEEVFNTGMLTKKISNYLLSYNYFTTYNNKKFCHYTSFYIDDIGFVRFQWFPFKEISSYFNPNK